MIPFTVDQFLNVFEQYNVAIRPAQVFLYTMGIVAVCLTLSRQKDFSRIVSLILSLFWIWMGIVGGIDRINANHLQRHIYPAGEREPLVLTFR